MCLSVREQRQLDSIDDAVSRSDPRLAKMLATFAQMTAYQAMPQQERLGSLPEWARTALHSAAETIRAPAAIARLIARHRGHASSPAST